MVIQCTLRLHIRYLCNRHIHLSNYPIRTDLTTKYLDLSCLQLISSSTQSINHEHHEPQGPYVKLPQMPSIPHRMALPESHFLRPPRNLSRSGPVRRVWLPALPHHKAEPHLCSRVYSVDEDANADRCANLGSDVDQRRAR